MDKPYIKYIGRIKKFRLFVVDGDYIRNNMEDNFALAGHQLAYPNMIPHLEIWIEETTHKSEILFLAVHEIFENKIMQWGVDYELAHEMANVIETACRKHPEKTKEVLSLV